MRNAHEIARLLINRYNEVTQSEFGSSELRLHKLMYFTQRQSLALTGKPLFSDDFEAWKHGPVLPDLRFFFDFSFTTYADSSLDETEEYIIDSVISEYGSLAAWALRDLTHQENSWLKGREGLNENDRGAEIMKLEDIYEDAKKVRVYDHLYDMYLDEFEDFEGEVFSSGYK